jgi:hypothetical protein
MPSLTVSKRQQDKDAVYVFGTDCRSKLKWNKLLANISYERPSEFFEKGIHPALSYNVTRFWMQVVTSSDLGNNYAIDTGQIEPPS